MYWNFFNVPPLIYLHIFYQLGEGRGGQKENKNIISRQKRKWEKLKSNLHVLLQEVVRYILETHTIDANARDNAGYTPLHESCVRGHLRVAKLLIVHGADVNAAALDGTR